MEKQKKRVLLVILDGWGHTESTKYNAIYTANTPNWDKIIETNSHAKLKCSGCDVGLPSAQMGNSEVGHMHLGSGRPILQDLSRINTTILDLLGFLKPDVMTGQSLFEKDLDS